jgi:hypothetical protein
VAKKNSPTRIRERDRRAVAEQLRREQAQRERRRSLLILGACVVVVLALLAAALIPYLKQVRKDNAAAATPVSDLGVSSAAAKCDPAKEQKATGNNVHIAPPKVIKYPEAPPAFGPHWGNFLQGPEIRTFYTPSDRPQLERLVHSLEHGHTIIWYDDTVKPGSKDYEALQQISRKLGLGSYVMSAPWTPKDGKAFPSGKHIAITHWTGPQNQQGVTQYCAAPSGSVVQDFLKKYPKEDAPEPGAA